MKQPRWNSAGLSLLANSRSRVFFLASITVIVIVVSTTCVVLADDAAARGDGIRSTFGACSNGILPFYLPPPEAYIPLPLNNVRVALRPRGLAQSEYCKPTGSRFTSEATKWLVQAGGVHAARLYQHVHYGVGESATKIEQAAGWYTKDVITGEQADFYKYYHVIGPIRGHPEGDFVSSPQPVRLSVSAPLVTYLRLTEESACRLDPTRCHSSQQLGTSSTWEWEVAWAAGGDYWKHGQADQKAFAVDNENPPTIKRLAHGFATMNPDEGNNVGSSYFLNAWFIAPEQIGEPGRYYDRDTAEIFWGAEDYEEVPSEEVVNVYKWNQTHMYGDPYPGPYQDPPPLRAYDWSDCMGDVASSPCSKPTRTPTPTATRTPAPSPTPCATGTWKWGQDVGGQPGRKYFCLRDMHTFCGAHKAIRIPWREVLLHKWAWIADYGVVGNCPVCSMCDNSSRPSKGVTFCDEVDDMTSVDNAAVSIGLASPPASWPNPIKIDILQTHLWPRQSRTWGSPSHVSATTASTYTLERYVFWSHREIPGTKRRVRVGVLVGALVRGRDRQAPDGGTAWVAAYGYRPEECGDYTGTGYHCHMQSPRCTDTGFPDPDPVYITPSPQPTSNTPTETPIP